MITGAGRRDYRGVHPIQRFVAVAPAIAVSWLASLANAEPVGLRFEAPTGCPNESEFVAAVGERGGHFDGPEAAARADSLEVEVLARNGSFAGSLRVLGSAGTSDLREVRDTNCAEVVRGLAVVAAIALGADGEQRSGDTMPAAAPAPKTADRGAKRKVETPPTERSRRLRGATFPLVDRVEVPAGTLHFDSERAYSLMAGAEFGTFPGFVLPRVDFTGALANFVTTPGGDSHLILPVIQLRSSLSAGGVRRFADYETRAVAFRLGVDICSLASYDSQGWVLMFCGEFGGGYAALRTRSLPGTPAYSQKKEGGFAYVGPAFDVRHNFGSLLHVGLRAGVTGQFGTVSAERRDGSQLLDMKPLGGYASAGLGLHF